MKSQLRVGTDVGYKSHRVAIAAPGREILEEFDISHSRFGHFFHWGERRRKRTEVPVAAAMEGYNGQVRLLYSADLEGELPVVQQARPVQHSTPGWVKNRSLPWANFRCC